MRTDVKSLNHKTSNYENKKLFGVVLICLCIVLTLDAQEKATVYFIRSTGFQGSAVPFTAFIDNELVCRLNNKMYSIHEVDPGEHTFAVQFSGKKAKKKAEPIVINTEAGKTYYVQMVFQTGLLVNNLYSQEVTENSAKTVLTLCKQDKKCL